MMSNTKLFHTHKEKACVCSILPLLNRFFFGSRESGFFHGLKHGVRKFPVKYFTYNTRGLF